MKATATTVSPLRNTHGQESGKTLRHTTTDAMYGIYAMPSTLYTSLYVFIYIVDIMFQFPIILKLQQHFSMPRDNGMSQEEWQHHLPHQQGFMVSPVDHPQDPRSGVGPI